MKLMQIILTDMNGKINFLKQHEEQFTKSLAKRASELDNIIKRLYEDNVLGKLSDELFTILSKDYEFEKHKLNQEIDELETRLSKQKEDVKNIQKFLEIVQKYTTLEKLTVL